MRIETLSEGEIRRQASGRTSVGTRGPGLTEITDAVAEWVSGTGIRSGLLTVFCRHTSASLLIQENADPDVRRDLLAAFDRLAPRNAGYVHTTEGPDDMPAHIRTVLSGVSLSIPVTEGQMTLGTWQGIYIAEHRDSPQRRDLIFHLIGT
ncbi:secondary thiamine-phosphate synthase enzyme YjbQ [Microvirga lotononidis]|uniref:Secondary thiamine-phosphate synthase enzyme n=1 Tax=Microvirga lotononidis TaxID=864069 RepID=I4YXP4_9HYPH|nr:secondary thiamine-phosphate synthase enzyme YjbQ [Microvirga lotononidis]EIM28736.1 secondary thiamine-phosphate synthase enzyme [Microvirga lotononidis]WQO25528.1 secondary thiamine-phosphate synthase enzyme YjbQ [Microvirga lotononidis]